MTVRRAAVGLVTGLVLLTGCASAPPDQVALTEPIDGSTPSWSPPGSSLPTQLPSDLPTESPSLSASTTTPSSPTTAPTTPPTTPLVADSAHAVPAPGPLTESLLPADMLVWSQDSLSQETVDAIRAVKGVTDVEPLSMAQVSIENEVLTVAAVDPATYRRFTPDTSAHLDEEWQRVAGGELAIVPALGRRLPTDEQGFLQLGNTAGAPRVHIGALAPQIEQAIDAVVNEKWGAEMGMKPGNAVLISTGSTSPQAVRGAVQKIAGETASVQRLDAVARYGLDISVQQTAFLVGTVADAVGTFNYTVLGGGRIAPEPSWVSSHIGTGVVPILGRVTCNRLIFPQLRAALQEVVTRGLSDAIHPGEYAGCYYPRFIAGTTTLSNHSFGLALDLNVPGNQRGTAGQMDRTVVSIFKKWGFAWGGDWRYTDPMHFEMNALVDPR